MPVIPFRNVAILGLGLIGGSLFHRLGTVATGYDADPETRAAAGRVAETVAEAVTGADLAVLAVPLPAMAEVLDAVHAAGYTGLLTDVTSVKAAPRRLAAEHCPGATWVGGHPMAGREQSGFAAADATLFDGCAWVLALEHDTDLDAWLGLASLVTSIGARVVPASADEHDAAVARISHAPHVLASALAARAGTDRMALTLGAGSFRDGTRVAATRPELTAAMCGGNAAAVRDELDALIDQLTDARGRLDDPAALTEWFRAGHDVRSQWPPSSGEPRQIPANRDALVTLGRAGGWITAISPYGSTLTAVTPARPPSDF